MTSPIINDFEQSLLARIAALEAKVTELAPPVGYIETKNYLGIGSGGRVISIFMVFGTEFQADSWRVMVDGGVIGEFSTRQKAVDAADKYLRVAL